VILWTYKPADVSRTPHVLCIPLQNSNDRLEISVCTGSLAFFGGRLRISQYMSPPSESKSVTTLRSPSCALTCVILRLPNSSISFVFHKKFYSWLIIVIDDPLHVQLHCYCLYMKAAMVMCSHLVTAITAKGNTSFCSSRFTKVMFKYPSNYVFMLILCNRDNIMVIFP
jgi:hypothetical protein